MCQLHNHFVDVNKMINILKNAKPAGIVQWQNVRLVCASSKVRFLVPAPFIFDERMMIMSNEINAVNVRWFDGYLETFQATEVRFGNDYLWMRLTNGENRHIPLRTVRWFSLSKKSQVINETLK